jgi:8-oxo-dGTP diphosphatase
MERIASDFCVGLAVVHDDNAIGSRECIKAAKLVMVEVDRGLDLFAGLVETGSHRSFALIALRHGHAVQPYEWDGADASRPLSARGREDARAIVPTLLAFGPRVVTSSTAERCMQTVAPLAEALGRRVKEDAGISQDAYETYGGSVRETVAKRVRKARSAVLCSHSPVLPEILHEIALATETPRASRMPRAGMLSPAEFSVVHLSASDPEAGILAVETYGPSA